MLPSSGAMQLKASGPNSERAASSYIAAQATIGSAMPPNSLGDCGAHSPAAFAFARTGSSRSPGMFSCSEKFSGSRSSGNTCVLDEGAGAQAEVFDLGRQREVHDDLIL